MELIVPSMKLIVLLLFGGVLLLLSLDYLSKTLKRFHLGPAPRFLLLGLLAAVVGLLLLIYFQLEEGTGLKFKPGEAEAFELEVFLSINPFNLPLLIFVLASLLVARVCAPITEGRQALRLLMVIGLMGIGFAGDFFNIYVYYELLILASLHLAPRGSEPMRSLGRLQLSGSLLALFALFLLFHYAGSFRLERVLKIAALPTVEQPFLAVLLLLVLALAMKAGLMPFGAVGTPQLRDDLEGAMVRRGATVFLLCRLAFPFSQLAYRLGWLFIVWGVAGVVVAIYRTWRERDGYPRLFQALPVLRFELRFYL